MSREEACYEEIVDAFAAAHADVEPGKMVSSDALTVNGKVFCFYWPGKESMVFKPGKSTDTERPRMAGWEWLNPFKNKGPMKAWYQVPFGGKKNWRLLADEALAVVCEGRG